MNTAEERKLFQAIGRIEQHLKDINGQVKETAEFKISWPKICEEKHQKVRDMVWKNRALIIAIFASGLSGGAGLLHLVGLF